MAVSSSFEGLASPLDEDTPAASRLVKSSARSLRSVRERRGLRRTWAAHRTQELDPSVGRGLQRSPLPPSGSSYELRLSQDVAPKRHTYNRA